MPWQFLAALVAAIPPAVLSCFIVYLPAIPLLAILLFLADIPVSAAYWTSWFILTFIATLLYSICIRFIRGLIPSRFYLKRLFPKRSYCKYKKVWVVPGNLIEAYALGGKRGLVILSEGAYNLPGPLVDFIIEHEKSHLRHKDFGVFLWSYSAVKTIESSHRVAYGITFFHRKIPWLEKIITIYFYLAISTAKLFFKIHWFLRRRADWAMEYRADKEAALNTSARSGILLLELLLQQNQTGIDIDTILGISSHPPLKSRIGRLKKLQKDKGEPRL